MPAASGTQSPRRTRGAVHWQDRAAGIVITVGGIGVIAAVLAIGVYLAMVALPLFAGARVEPPREASVRGAGEDASSGATIGVPRAMFVDDYGLGACVVDAGGVARWIAVDTGEVAGSVPVKVPEKKPSAWSANAEGSLLAIGYEDGSIQFGSVEFETSLLSLADVPENARALSVGRSRAWRDDKASAAGTAGLGGVVARLNEREWRVVRPVLKLSAPVALTLGSGRVERLAYAKSGEAELVAALRADGSMTLDRVTTTRPLGGGPPRVKLEATPIALALPGGGAAGGLPDALYVTSDASDVLLLWGDGRCQRYANHSEHLEAIPLAETIELLPKGRQLTASGMLLGGLTMLLGDDQGEVRAVFAAHLPERGTIDGRTLLVGHTLASLGHRVTSLGISQRTRMVAIGDAVGNVALRSVASDKDVADLTIASARSASQGASTGGAQNASEKARPPEVLGAAFVRSESVVALHADDTIRAWHLDPGHPEVSVHSLFAKVHYEGQSAPEHTYQSSSASDSAEVKLGLMPLIHGTLKATLFAMLFAVPIAVGGAVYTSEFLHPTWRTRIKPAVEMMASLPSVVLGFVAAMVVAPLVRGVVPVFLAGLIVVPMCVLIGAHLWQLAPGPVIARTGAAKRLAMVAACMAIGVLLASLLGPAIESRLFTASRSDKLVAAGFFEALPEKDWPAWVGRRDTMSPDDERHLRAEGFYFRDRVVVKPVEPSSSEGEAKIREAAAAQGIEQGDLLRWLDGSIGGAWPGWFAVLIPLGLIGVWVARVSTPLRRLDRFLQQPTEFRGALSRLVALGASMLSAIALAGMGASMLSAIGLDPRDMMFGPFNQRNSLVVGIIMGFAIIPIIYTISEDAMSSVPASLRTASLGAGATPWQTAVRVVLPVAASGIFSALMIGLGRAVGETMIVVMATGNTPSMDWSVFSGFRTLSANIAVELPEAPQHSTHYRVLFLCGLALFVMTFIVNTTAEVVRQRVRRRIASL